MGRWQTGVRRLLDSLRKDDSITRSHATQTILRQTSFNETELRDILGPEFASLSEKYFVYSSEEDRFTWRHEQIKRPSGITDKRLRELYAGDYQKAIDSIMRYSLQPKVTTGRVFDLLLERDFFRAGLELYCNEL